MYTKKKKVMSFLKFDFPGTKNEEDYLRKAKEIIARTKNDHVKEELKKQFFEEGVAVVWNKKTYKDF